MKAVITGASSGLGAAFAKWLSLRQYTVVLIARHEEALLRLQEELPNNSEIIVADLTNMTDISKVCVYLQEEKIDMLINNAGIGCYGEFWKIPVDQEKTMMELNMLAPALLMKSYIAHQETGRILNVASIAAKQSDPLMAGYGASKAFLLMLSKSVNVELAYSSKDILIQTCLPGSFISDFDKQAKIVHSLANEGSDDIAGKIMRDVFKNKKIIVPGTKNKGAYYLGKIIPERIMNKIEYKLQKSKE